MATIDLGPGSDDVRSCLARVATLTPDEALALTQAAAAITWEGRPAAAARAQAALAGLEGTAARDVRAGVWAAYEAARQGPGWRSAWDAIFAITDPRRRADAAGAQLATIWDADRLIEETAAALAAGPLLPAIDAALVLAPWRALVGELLASPLSGDA